METAALSAIASKSGLWITPLRAAQIADLRAFWKVRDSDLVEAGRLDGTKTQDELISEIAGASGQRFVVYDSVGPVAVFGLAVGPSGIGIPWFLADSRVSKYERVLVRCGRLFIKLAHEQYATLFNWVDDTNQPAKRFLEFLGFQFGNPVNFNGWLFRSFIRWR